MNSCVSWQGKSGMVTIFKLGRQEAFLFVTLQATRYAKCNDDLLPIIISLQANHYKILGCYAAISIIQGGPGFPFFRAHVYAYLCTGIWSPVTISAENLPNEDVRTVVSKVHSTL